MVHAAVTNNMWPQAFALRDLQNLVSHVFSADLAHVFTQDPPKDILGENTE